MIQQLLCILGSLNISKLSIMKLRYIIIIGSALLMTSCSEALFPEMDLAQEQNIVVVDDIELSDITLTKISYLERDSVIFISSTGEEAVGRISKVNQLSEILNHSENCQLNGETDNSAVLFQYNWQYIVVYLEFEELNVNFNIGYKANYYSCCSGEQYDNMVVTRNNCTGGNRLEVLRLLTDQKNLSEELVQCGFKLYDFKYSTVNSCNNTFDKVYQGRDEQHIPVHFYYNFQNEIISFKDNDGVRWDVKM